MRLIQEGPRNAKIIIVGEAPGASEDSSGRPFQGGAGQILTHMLSRTGISRGECFITNVCHVRPPGNDFQWFYRKAGESALISGLVLLKRDIESIRPNLVIGLGSQPLRLLTGKHGIEKWRGSILRSTLVAGVKTICTYHPAAILRTYDYKAVAEFDLLRCAKEAAYPEIRRPHRDFYLDPSPDVRQRVGDEMCRAEWLAIDIECTYREAGGWRLSCVGFSDRASRALVIPIRTPEDKAFVQKLCASPAKKVFQNGTFDCTVLKDEGIEVVGFEWDTMLAHHSIFPECASGGDELSALTGRKRQSAIAKGLAFQTSIYTDEPFYKDDGKVGAQTGDMQMFWRYNGLDCTVTREIRDVQEGELTAFGTWSVFKHEMSLVQPLMDATRIGIKVDTAARDRLLNDLTLEVARLQNLLNAGAGWEVNTKSIKDIPKLLYDQLKLAPKKKRRKDGEYTITADKTAIAELAEDNSHPLLHTILAIRERRDIIERYLTGSIDSDGRIRCSFDITGTRSGRLSSRESIYGSGSNLQNQPEKLRHIYVPDPGKIFVYRDYSQAEARVVAYLAQETGLISLFNDPTRDVHKENASRIFGIPISEVNDERRYLAKRIIHASNYGMEAKKFVDVVNKDATDSWARKGTGIRINLAEARRLLEAYFILYPGIRDVFWKDVERELRATRILTTPFGRKRQFFGRWEGNPNFLLEAYSYIPQSTVGDLCCKALVRCYHEIPECQVLLNVHDSILVQCNVEDAETVARKMEECMAIEITLGDYKFTLPTDCKVGFNWGNKGKDGSNPNGLQDISKWVKERAA